MYYSHGRALIRMGEYDSAMVKLQLARKMEPNNLETIKEIRLVNIELQNRRYIEEPYISFLLGK